MFFIPYEVDLVWYRRPWANYGVIGLCVLIFCWEEAILLSSPRDTSAIEYLAFDGLSIGIITHMFLHANIFHIIGNMIPLWVFGNAICSKIGTWKYLLIYLGTGLVAVFTHWLFDGSPMLGASGAISGILGFYLALYPTNTVTCCYLIFLRPGTCGIKGYWIMIWWFGMDILYAVMNVHTGTAHWAHIGGFFAGLGVALMFLKLNKISFTKADAPNLFQKFTGVEPPIEPFPWEEIPAEEIFPIVAPIPDGPTFYLYANDQQLGPYPIAVIRQLLATNQISQNDLIFQQETQAWIALCDFPFPFS